MPITITPTQHLALEAQQLRRFAAEVAHTLAPIVGSRSTLSSPEAAERFTLEQIEQASARGLTRRNELMAWALCGLVLGGDFEQRIPQVAGIVAERHYDRSVLLTQLALEGLRDAGSST